MIQPYGGSGGGGRGSSELQARARAQSGMQIFTGGVSRSERALVAGTGGSVAAVEANIATAVAEFGAPPGAKKMMNAELLAAEEAIRTGLYGVWRNASSCHDFCGRVGPKSRCFCGHEGCDHAWGKGKKSLRPACTKCPCKGFQYIPRRPEEVGEYWLPRRRGFDVNIWRAKCKCQHGHEDHDPNFGGCRLCGCTSFSSAWECVVCDGKWEDHETLWETEDERRIQGRPVGAAFKPLASTPQIQDMVLNQQAGGRSASLPHRPRPERSVKLMLERCPNYGGAAGSLEDAFPPRGGGAGHMQGSLEDAFPSRRGGSGLGAMGSLEDAFPPRGGGAGHMQGSLEDAFPPRRGGSGLGAMGSLEDAFPPAGGRRAPALEDAFPPRGGSGRPPRGGSSASSSARDHAGGRQDAIECAIDWNCSQVEHEIPMAAGRSSPGPAGRPPRGPRSGASTPGGEGGTLAGGPRAVRRPPSGPR